LDFELRYTKMLKDARVASNGFLIRTSESTDFAGKTLGGRQVQVHLMFYWTSTANIDYSIKTAPGTTMITLTQYCAVDVGISKSEKTLTLGDFEWVELFDQSAQKSLVNRQPALITLHCL